MERSRRRFGVETSLNREKKHLSGGEAMAELKSPINSSIRYPTFPYILSACPHKIPKVVLQYRNFQIRHRSSLQHNHGSDDDYMIYNISHPRCIAHMHACQNDAYADHAMDRFRRWVVNKIYWEFHRMMIINRQRRRVGPVGVLSVLWNRGNIQVSTRRGRGKNGSVVIDNQSLDTKLNLAIDFSGSLESLSMVRSVGIWAKPRAEAQTARDLNKSPRYYGPQSINTQWAKAQVIQDGHTVQTTRNRAVRPRRAARRRHYRRSSEPAEPPHVHKRSSPYCLHTGGSPPTLDHQKRWTVEPRTAQTSSKNFIAVAGELKLISHPRRPTNPSQITRTNRLYKPRSNRHTQNKGSHTGIKELCEPPLTLKKPHLPGSKSGDGGSMKASTPPPPTREPTSTELKKPPSPGNKTTRTRINSPVTSERHHTDAS
ncbi:hypothetical protein YC2023_081736 [Brassica napus]